MRRGPGRFLIGDEDGAVLSGVSLSLSVATLYSSEFTPSTDAVVRHRQLKFVMIARPEVVESYRAKTVHLCSLPAALRL